MGRQSRPTSLPSSAAYQEPTGALPLGCAVLILAQVLPPLPLTTHTHSPPGR